MDGLGRALPTSSSPYSAQHEAGADDRGTLDLDVDLRDASAGVRDTAAALSLCLREGDLSPAERLFGFLCEHQPDRRLLLGEVLQPLFRDDLRSLAMFPAERDVFLATTRDLLLRQRTRLVNTRASGVLLCARRDDEHVLALYMVALLLDEVGVAAHVLEGADERGISRIVTSRRDGAVCLAASAARELGDLIGQLRRRQVAVVLAGDGVREDADLVRDVGASGGACRVTDVADMLLYLRGPLTAAESAVLRLAADGYTNVRMAHELELSVSAVKARLESSYLKMHAADRTHAVAISLRERWIR
jgi:DNA-binding NarL/FixJ family response regulator